MNIMLILYIIETLIAVPVLAIGGYKVGKMDNGGSRAALVTCILGGLIGFCPIAGGLLAFAVMIMVIGEAVSKWMRNDPTILKRQQEYENQESLHIAEIDREFEEFRKQEQLKEKPEKTEEPEEKEEVVEPILNRSEIMDL